MGSIPIARSRNLFSPRPYPLAYMPSAADPDLTQGWGGLPVRNSARVNLRRFPILLDSKNTIESRPTVGPDSLWNCRRIVAVGTASRPEGTWVSLGVPLARPGGPG